MPGLYQALGNGGPSMRQRAGAMGRPMQQGQRGYGAPAGRYSPPVMGLFMPPRNPEYRAGAKAPLPAPGGGPMPMPQGPPAAGGMSGAMGPSPRLQEGQMPGRALGYGMAGGVPPLMLLYQLLMGGGRGR